MRDLRSDPLDKEATKRPDNDPLAEVITGELPDLGLPDPEEVERQERRRHRRGLLLRAGLPTLAVAAVAAGLLTWTEAGRSVGRSAVWLVNPPPPVQVGVSPAKGAEDVRLDAPVRVKAEHGRLTEVEVVGEDGKRLAGKLSPKGHRWESTRPLQPGTRYTVRWAAVNAQDTPRRDRTGFTTLTPDAKLEVASVLPVDGETVGVGQPIVIGFSQPVENKEAVEQALTVTNTKHRVGAWHWTSDDQVRYRPAQYWPAHSKVRLTADLAGVDAGGGVWGVKDWSLSFDVGAKQVSTVDVTTHTMTVEVDGEVVREMPMSAGRPGWDTQNGIHWVMEKFDFMVMDSATFGMPGLYTQPVSYATRISGDGEFVHAAPWSVGDQGSANVSHGCINLSTDNAGWFFEMAQRGDIVEVVGSPEPPQPTDGVIEWNQSFVDWSEGSALSDAPSSTQPI